MKIVVGIATRGRPAIVRLVVDHLRHQTLHPAAVVVSCPTPEDAGGLERRPGVRVLLGPPGLARQRNAILEALDEDVDLVVFFDDDFVPHRDWLAAAVRTFRERPDVGCVTGAVLADGIKGPGIAFVRTPARRSRSSVPRRALPPSSAIPPTAATWRCAAPPSARCASTSVWCSMAGWRTAISVAPWQEAAGGC